MLVLVRRGDVFLLVCVVDGDTAVEGVGCGGEGRCEVGVSVDIGVVIAGSGSTCAGIGEKSGRGAGCV